MRVSIPNHIWNSSNRHAGFKKKKIIEIYHGTGFKPDCDSVS